jgi:NADH oxidase (H2O-forming)
MRPVRIVPGVHWVGVLDTQLRVFDVIMEAQHGTSYNSYVVRGRDQVALIDASKEKFAETFLGTLRPATDPAEIDYLVCNHLEPDHSGALADVLEVAPQAQVVVSKAGKALVQAVLNRDVNPRVVKEGDRIDLGGKTLRFISAPFLHWPDTMFTYLEEDQILFSGDFLGAHYCDPRLFNDLMENYDEAFHYYFQVIMRPFKEYVRQALDKLDGLPIKMVCPVHGPILRTDIGRYLAKYREWSAEAPRGERKRLLVFYVSSYGNTLQMAEAIARGIREAGAETEVRDLTALDRGQALDAIEAADGILVGSCTINGDALEHAWGLLSSLTTIKVKDKLGAAFGSFGWSGEGPLMLTERLKGLKFRVPEEPLRVQLVPSQADLKSCEEYGRRLVAAL